MLVYTYLKYSLALCIFRTKTSNVQVLTLQDITRTTVDLRDTSYLDRHLLTNVYRRQMSKNNELRCVYDHGDSSNVLKRFDN